MSDETTPAPTPTPTPAPTPTSQPKEASKGEEKTITIPAEGTQEHASLIQRFTGFLIATEQRSAHEILAWLKRYGF